MYRQVQVERAYYRKPDAPVECAVIHRTAPDAGEDPGAALWQVEQRLPERGQEVNRPEASLRLRRGDLRCVGHDLPPDVQPRAVEVEPLQSRGFAPSASFEQHRQDHRLPPRGQGFEQAKDSVERQNPHFLVREFRSLRIPGDVLPRVPVKAGIEEMLAAVEKLG